MSGWSKSLPPAKRRSRWLLGLGVLGVALVAGTWISIRTFPWFGPLLADTLRAVIGSERVTQLEETVADIEDRVKHVASNGKARGLSESTPSDLLVPAAPEASPKNAESTASTEDDGADTLPLNKPQDVAPMFPKVASSEDGRWQAVPLRSGESNAVYRTIVHPDPERAYAELFVFALDLSRVDLHAVAGSIEPRSPTPVPGVERPGVIPESDRGRLVAAFNGGFKAEHGQFGMLVNGNELLLPPRPSSCTFAALSSGGFRIGTWSALEAQSAEFSFWRQTPGCMVEDGVLHPGLRSADSRNWGATLEGKTVIRRSAVGLSRDGKILFVGISNSTTARALALGMQHVGSVSVAQLDVNFSYPRFLLYREDAESGALKARGAVNGLLYQPNEYIGRASTRDFFYVTLRG